MGGVSGGAGLKKRVEGRDRLLLFLVLEGALGLFTFREVGDDEEVLVLDPKASDVESSAEEEATVPRERSQFERTRQSTAKEE